MAKPTPGTSLALPADQAEPIAAIEEMIATLNELRQRTSDRALLAPTRPRSTGSTRSQAGRSGRQAAPCPGQAGAIYRCAIVAAAHAAARAGRGGAQAEAALMDRRQ